MQRLLIANLVVVADDDVVVDVISVTSTAATAATSLQRYLSVQLSSPSCSPQTLYLTHPSPDVNFVLPMLKFATHDAWLPGEHWFAVGSKKIYCIVQD